MYILILYDIFSFVEYTLRAVSKIWEEKRGFVFPASLSFSPRIFDTRAKRENNPSPVRSFASERFGYHSCVVHADIPLALLARAHTRARVISRILDEIGMERSASLSRASVSISGRGWVGLAARKVPATLCRS